MAQTSSTPSTPPESAVDASETARFAAMADKWWDAEGPFAPLHRLNRFRLTHIRASLCAHFGRESAGLTPLSGLKILDVGCGGGLLSEPMARLGAEVTGIDPGAPTIDAARQHAKAQGLRINYKTATAEDLGKTHKDAYDVILNMEVIEHVPHVPSFVAACAHLIRPGGVMFCATINRTLPAFMLAIIGAEYILRWLPVGTHHWDKFVTPDEMRDACRRAGLHMREVYGATYNPLSGDFMRTSLLHVNYMALAEKPL